MVNLTNVQLWHYMRQCVQSAFSCKLCPWCCFLLLCRRVVEWLSMVLILTGPIIIVGCNSVVRRREEPANYSITGRTTFSRPPAEQ